MQSANIIISEYKKTPVVCGFIDDKLEYLSFARDSELNKVYIGKVDHIVKNLDAAFIRFGQNTIGYLSLKNIVDACITSKKSKTDAILKAGDEVLVQIDSEAIKTKKCKLTTGISISGKYCVVTLGRSGVGASVKLEDSIRKRVVEETKDRLTALSNEYKKLLYDTGCGFIIRTSVFDIIDLSEQSYIDLIAADAECVLQKLANILKESRLRTIYSCIYSPMSNNGSEDDILSACIKKADAFLKIRGFNDALTIQDTGIHGIVSKIDSLKSGRVWLKSGAFLIIEQLESFNAIDVNTGKAIKGKKDISFEVNLEAADEIMRQIRLRNLTGMILIDFINMKDTEDYDKLTDHIKELCRMDPVHTTFVDITGLGIVELIRNKNDKSLKEILQDVENSVDI